MGSCTTNSLGYCLGQMLADTPTGSSFRVRAISASGNPIANQAITFLVARLGQRDHHDHHDRASHHDHRAI
jgi:hypothetical protein